jgi:hypothetical protein
VGSFHEQGSGVCAFFHVNFEIFLFLYFETPKFSIFFLSFWRFHMGEKNVGVIVLKFGSFEICFDGIQGSSTLCLGILGVFLKTFNELELVVPLVFTHGNILN